MNRNLNLAVLLLSVFALVVFLYLAVKTPKFEKAEPELSHQFSHQTERAPVRSKTDYSLIAKNDLFHPYRGKPPAETEAVKPEKKNPQSRLKFELRGVFHSGGRYGALIQVAGNKPIQPGDLKKADAEVFFIGSTVAEGYTLESVESKSVTIMHNNEKIVVEMEKLKPPELDDEKKADETKSPESPSIKKNDKPKSPEPPLLGSVTKKIRR